MSAATILALANGTNVDLLAPRLAGEDLWAIAEHLGKEKRFNGATPNREYSVAEHCCRGADAILAAGHGEIAAGYFLLHDAHEALWKDDTTPKKRALAEIASSGNAIRAAELMLAFDIAVRHLDEEIHRAAGLPFPAPKDIAQLVHHFDKVMFVTEWRDLMHGAPHPNWGPYEDIDPLKVKLNDPWPWAMARAAWMYRAKRWLPTCRPAVTPPLAHGKSRSTHAGSSS